MSTLGYIEFSPCRSANVCGKDQSAVRGLENVGIVGMIDRHDYLSSASDLLCDCAVGETTHGHTWRGCYNWGIHQNGKTKQWRGVVDTRLNQISGGIYLGSHRWITRYCRIGRWLKVCSEVFGLDHNVNVG